MLSLICTRINGWVNNRKAGDLRRNRAHYDITVMLANIIPVYDQTLAWHQVISHSNFNRVGYVFVKEQLAKWITRYGWVIVCSQSFCHASLGRDDFPFQEDRALLKIIRCHFGEIFIVDSIRSYQNDNFQCSQLWKFRQNGISIWVFPLKDVPPLILREMFGAKSLLPDTNNISLSIEPLGTNFSEIGMKIFSRKCIWKFRL